MIKRKLITAGFVIAMAAMVMSGCKSGGTDKETTAAAAGETAGSQESGTASGETKSEEELTDEARAEIKEAMVAATEPKVEEMCGKEILETFRN